MRLYYIVSGILLILPIINLVVTAPVLVQEKLQARVDVVHMPKDAGTKLGKRGGELDELWVKLFGYPEDHFFWRSCQPRIRRRARRRRSPLMGRLTSSNHYRLSIKNRYWCPVRTMYRRTEVTS
jgi:hypothetical protein